GFPGTGFADDAERLALADVDAHAVDGLDVTDGPAHDAALDREPDLEIVGLYHHRRIGHRRRRIRLRFGGEQRPGIGMFGRREHTLDLAVLDDLALAHHADAV